MTNEEAIYILQCIEQVGINITKMPSVNISNHSAMVNNAINIAIEALKNERDFEKEYMEHYKQGRKDERAILNGELLQSCSELDMRSDKELDEDAKQASIPYTYDAPQHDWKCGYPNPTIKNY